jgi:hypothetical protein
MPKYSPESLHSFSKKIHQLDPHSSVPRVTTSLVLWWRPRQPRELLLAYKYEGRGREWDTSPPIQASSPRESARVEREKESHVPLHVIVLHLD